jgi:hypothetical protein
MAPAPSKHATEITAPRKRKASSNITDDNFVGAESNVFTKRLKKSADADTARAAAAAEKHQKRQPSVQDETDDDDTDTVPLNSSPKNPNVVLEAANGSDDDIEMDDEEPAPKKVGKEKPKIAKRNETAEEELGESSITQKRKFLTLPH